MTGFAHRAIGQPYAQRTLNVFALYDEIGALGGAPTTRPSSTRPATPFSRPVLQGFWHKHFSTPAFIVRNLLNHWNTKRLVALVEDVAADDSIPADQKAAFLTQRVILGATSGATVKAG